MIKRSGIALFFLAASAALLTATEASAAVLFDNSNITTGIGNGANAANTSAIATGDSTYGFSSNAIGTSTLALAEDFTLAGSSSISLVTFDAYSTSTYPNPPVSPFTGATVKIWSAQPGTAGATVLFTSTTLSATAWTGVYRVQSTTLTNAQRPVFSLSVGFTGVTLAAGNYWASFAATSLAAPGVATSVFTPPVMNADGTQPAGNAIQSADGGTTWTATADTTSLATNRVPLTIVGAVPEPATWAMMLGGVCLLGVGQRFRRARRA